VFGADEALEGSGFHLNGLPDKSKEQLPAGRRRAAIEAERELVQVVVQVVVPDGHGSTRALLDATSTFIQSYACTAYGPAPGKRHPHLRRPGGHEPRLQR
jgi:hypothetical protein